MAAKNINVRELRDLIESKKPVLVDFWATWVPTLPQDQPRLRTDRRGVRRQAGGGQRLMWIRMKSFGRNWRSDPHPSGLAYGR